MAEFVEFVVGTWLEGLEEEVGREAEALCRVMTQGVVDAMLALAMFETACSFPRDFSSEAWERERGRERVREEELAAAEDPREFTAPDYMKWRLELSERARRSIIREKWVSGELSDGLKHRLPFLHAQTFVHALAQVFRALQKLAALNLGDAEAEVTAACGDFERAAPSLKGVRDSVEHAEDRSRGRSHGQKMTLAPVLNTAIHAPGGGVLIAGMLNNNNFGWTIADGTYQEVEVSDRTIEAARAAVQRALDALPWKEHGYPHYVPS
jgi:hypothetical protein